MRALFSPPRSLPASPSSQLRLAARPRALTAATKPRFLSPHRDPAVDSGGRGARDVVAMVVPFLRGTAWEQPPPDLASFLYKNQIFSSPSPITCAAVAVAPTQISDQNTTPEVRGFFGAIDRRPELHQP